MTSDTARQASPDMSGTTPRATGLDHSRASQPPDATRTRALAELSKVTYVATQVRPMWRLITPAERGDSNPRWTERPIRFSRPVRSSRRRPLGPVAPRADPRLPSKWWDHLQVRPHELLEVLLTASSFNHDASVCRCPYDSPDDQRLTHERPEAVPYRRLEGVAELIAPGPPLDVDQLVALDSTQEDPLDAPAAADAAAERHRGDRRATPFELGPYVVARKQLVSTRAESRLVDP